MSANGYGPIAWGWTERQWYRGMVETVLPALLRRHLERHGDDYRELAKERRALGAALVDWFCLRPKHFVRWTPYPQHRLWDAPGYWTFAEDAAEQALPTAVNACLTRIRAQREAAAHPTLGDWLEAERRGMLEWEGPREAYAGDLLGSVAIKAPAAGFRAACGRARGWRQRFLRLQTAWPRLCACCGAEFRGPAKTTKRCPDCRRSRRRPGPDRRPA